MSNVLVPISKFVAELGEALARGDGYIMGAYGQNPRTGHLDLAATEVKPAWRPGGWYYSQYTDPAQQAQALKWREQCTRVWDCNGLAEGIYQLHTGVCINSKARYNYAEWCDPRGEGMIPTKYRVPGAAVFWGKSAGSIEHVAYLYEPVESGNPAGDWYLIEARGVLNGVVRTRLYSRNPGYWGLMTKFFDYSTAEEVTSPGVLQRGDEGEEVRALQAALVALGYNLGTYGPDHNGVDGEFGKATEAAVRAFQKKCGLPETGIFGPAAQAALDTLNNVEPEPEPTYTVTIKGVTKAAKDKLLAEYPTAEVAKE